MTQNPTITFIIASMKMFIRDRQALFWSIFLPMVIMVIFGVVNWQSMGSIKLGVVDQSQNEYSRQLIDGFKQIETFTITEGDLDSEKKSLEKGERDMVVVIPQGLGSGVAKLTTYYNDGRQQQYQIGRTILQSFLDKITMFIAKTPTMFELEAQPIKSRNLTYVDFLIPGIVGMAIMQLGIFSVAFGFVQLKQRGTLRRLLATPVHPMSFLIGQISTRLVMVVLQVIVLLSIGVFVFNLHLIGSFAEILLIGAFGSVVFLSLGYAIAGWAKNENQAAPMANIIAMPMMFLSGTFFPEESMPQFLRAVTDYLPLTYLNHALRQISLEGVSFTQLPTDLLGLGIWSVVSLVLAVKLFRWE